MATILDIDSGQKPIASKFYDYHRKAHRVFLGGKRTSHFNPFRHIPWVSKDRADVEDGPGRRSKSDQSKS